MFIANLFQFLTVDTICRACLFLEDRVHDYRDTLQRSGKPPFCSVHDFEQMAHDHCHIHNSQELKARKWCLDFFTAFLFSVIGPPLS